MTKKEIMDKKMKLKEKFNAEYDEQEGGKSFYDELKAEVNQQAQVCIKIFCNGTGWIQGYILMI